MGGRKKKKVFVGQKKKEQNQKKARERTCCWFHSSVLEARGYTGEQTIRAGVGKNRAYLPPAWMPGGECGRKGTKKEKRKKKQSKAAAGCCTGSKPRRHKSWWQTLSTEGPAPGWGRHAAQRGGHPVSPQPGLTFRGLTLPHQEGPPGVFGVEQQPLGLPASDLPEIPPAGGKAQAQRGAPVRPLDWRAAILRRRPRAPLSAWATKAPPKGGAAPGAPQAGAGGGIPPPWALPPGGDSLRRRTWIGNQTKPNQTQKKSPKKYNRAPAGFAQEERDRREGKALGGWWFFFFLLLFFFFFIKRTV